MDAAELSQCDPSLYALVRHDNHNQKLFLNRVWNFF
jgi:hypothetical protein